jgi:hypothetical protein
MYLNYDPKVTDLEHFDEDPVTRSVRPEIDP